MVIKHDIKINNNKLHIVSGNKLETQHAKINEMTTATVEGITAFTI